MEEKIEDNETKELAEDEIPKSIAKRFNWAVFVLLYLLLIFWSLL